MADEKPSLHVDTDWKKQAQEEKRRLAEKEQQQKSGQAAPAAAATAAAAPAGAGRESRQLPPASFASLVQTFLTQALYYLGDLATRSGGATVNLDMAKHQIDTLGVLEEKTRNNLTDDEKRLLDTALYEARMRYVSVASQYLGP